MTAALVAIAMLAAILVPGVLAVQRREVAEGLLMLALLLLMLAELLDHWPLCLHPHAWIDATVVMRDFSQTTG